MRGEVLRRKMICIGGRSPRSRKLFVLDSLHCGQSRRERLPHHCYIDNWINGLFELERTTEGNGKEAERSRRRRRRVGRGKGQEDEEER